ncbi:MAG: hypothetical protein K6G44_08110 [Lentisphaeria bacterium]|nr:hypothetical protein [Lentisphaeria bacterium]
MKKLLLALKNASSIIELSVQLCIRSRTYIREKMIMPALQEGLIELEQPESKRSPTQKYRLTEKGRLVVDKLEKTRRKRKIPPK